MPWPDIPVFLFKPEHRIRFSQEIVGHQLSRYSDELITEIYVCGRPAGNKDVVDPPFPGNLVRLVERILFFIDINGVFDILQDTVKHFAGSLFRIIVFDVVLFSSFAVVDHPLFPEAFKT
jgi:hypothetical protein